MYDENDFLQLSGLQHFAFCRRQWALIHIENQWQEDLRTVEGQILHARAHEEGFRESRGDRLIVRGLSIHSAALGVSGQCDVVEFVRDARGVLLAGREGRWLAYPVEYKHGQPKENPADRLQLCAQAMCLEEMLCCDIPEGALFYGQTRRRETVAFTVELRQAVREMLEEMHQLYQKGHTPRVKPTKSCNACSLKELCLPKLTRTQKVRDYLAAAVEDTP